MPTPQARLEDIEARIANGEHRLAEAKAELAELQGLGLPTRAVETGIGLMVETLDSMKAYRQILIAAIERDAEAV